MLPLRPDKISFFVLLLTITLLQLLPVKISYGQKTTQIEILNANTLEGKRVRGVEIRRLIGDVIFKQDNVMMYCDSAHQFIAENRMDAFGNVRINQGDSLKLSGKLLKYDGNKKIAEIFKNVKMTDGKMNLSTEALVYNMQGKTAHYPVPGRIIDGNNTLTSKTGTYFSERKEFMFIDSVVLMNPQYIMRTDSLIYHSVTEIAFFQGPCFIESRDEEPLFIYCEEGWYNSISKESLFSKNAEIRSGVQKLKGDSIYYNKLLEVGKSFGNVSITDTVEHITLSGDYGEYHEMEQFSFMTGKAVLKQNVVGDTLFMHADTLFTFTDSSGAFESYRAYYRVKIYKSDLQGKCDSLVYSESDSCLRFFGDPVIWSAENQLTATYIKLQMANNKADQLFLQDESFIASEEFPEKFNQIRGRSMTGYFKNNELHKIFVNGNGQTIYYAINNEKKEIGVNRAECSDMIIYVGDKKVQKVSLIDAPSAVFYPPGELERGELKLRGFTWQPQHRPASSTDIFKW